MKKPLVIGHRGFAARFPENTLPSFSEAFRAGAHGIEFDVQFSNDNIPIILHDSRLERTTNAKGYCHHFTTSELANFDAGYCFDPKKSGSFLFRGKALRIPTFEDILLSFPTQTLLVEIKPKSRELVHACMKLIVKHGRAKDVIVGSQHHAVSDEMKKSYPDILRFYSQREIVIAYLNFQRGAKISVDKTAVASMPLEKCGLNFSDPKFIAYLHTHQIQAYYWTINDPRTVLRLARDGADGIISDDPEQALKQLGD